MFTAASAAGKEIDEKGLSYNALTWSGGHNSNSVANTLAQVMGLTLANIGGWSPGFDDLLLTNSRLKDYWNEYGLGEPWCVHQPYEIIDFNESETSMIAAIRSADFQNKSREYSHIESEQAGINTCSMEIPLVDNRIVSSAPKSDIERGSEKAQSIEHIEVVILGTNFV